MLDIHPTIDAIILILVVTQYKSPAKRGFSFRRKESSEKISEIWNTVVQIALSSGAVEPEAREPSLHEGLDRHYQYSYAA
uniref:MADF domain-containing protein n=1 Tax=Caenorhabditis tropicalis TaxID=1561998 RepID=A0A1I7T8Z2_9PELO